MLLYYPDFQNFYDLNTSSRLVLALFLTDALQGKTDIRKTEDIKKILGISNTYTPLKDLQRKKYISLGCFSSWGRPYRYRLNFKNPDLKPYKGKTLEEFLNGHD